MDAPSEHKVIDLDRGDQPSVEPLSHIEAQAGSDQGQNTVLPVDIRRSLAVIKAKDLERRQFPYPLLDIDVGQVEQN